MLRTIYTTFFILLLSTLGSRALELTPIGTYATGIFDDGAAEIVAHDPSTQRVFVTNANDSRSDDKGPEPEGIEVGKIGSKLYAFIGLERIGGIIVYDVTDPTSPEFETYVNNRNFGVDAEDPAAGDLGPEGLHFISASESPNGEPLLIVGNEISGTTTIYQIETRTHKHGRR